MKRPGKDGRQHGIPTIIKLGIVLCLIMLSCSLTVSHLRNAWKLDLINKIALEEKIEPEWVMAVMMAESKFDSSKVSRSGAVGLMQLMPTTAQRLAEDLGWEDNDLRLDDPELNIRLGCHFLAQLKQRYPGGLAVIFAAYHAGEGAADRWLGNADPALFRIDSITIPQTLHYVRAVINNLVLFRLFWGTVTFFAPSSEV